MSRKTTNILANLPNELVVTKFEEHPYYNVIHIDHPPDRTCPHCGSLHCVVKDSGREHKAYHTPCNGKTTHLILHRGRFLCRDCGRSFMELPYWLHPSLHLTQPLFLSLCMGLTRMESVSAVAARYCVPPEMASAVLRLIHIRPPRELPEVLCMDEFKGDTGTWNPDRKHWDTMKFHASLVNGRSRTVIDILPKIQAPELRKYFTGFPKEDRRKVKFFCCDMHNGFISTAKDMFPSCTVCIDKFHVIKHLNEDMVDGTRRRLQKDPDLPREQYALLKGSMRILKTKETNFHLKYLTSEQKALARLEAILDAFPDLSEAYEALQEYHYINDMSAYLVQRTELTDWISRYSESGVPEVASAARMIKHWRGYIQNTWKHGHSNGVCEGFNNRIKVLKRVSYGLHDFPALRTRILLTCGGARLSEIPGALFAKNITEKGECIL